MSKVRTNASLADVFYKGQLLAHATLSLENFNWKLDGNILPLFVLSKLLLQSRKINVVVLTWHILQVSESSVSSINSLFQITWNFPSKCRSSEIEERQSTFNPCFSCLLRFMLFLERMHKIFTDSYLGFSTSLFLATKLSNVLRLEKRARLNCNPKENPFQTRVISFILPCSHS